MPGLEPLLEPGLTYVDLLEIEPQTLWHFIEDNPRPYALPQATLDHLKALPQPKLIHSVGNAVAGTHVPRVEFRRALSDIVCALDAKWASEHLSFTQFGDMGRHHTSFMLPPLQTTEGARRAAQTTRLVRAHLPVPFAVETGVNYLKPRPGELEDGEFVARVVEEADCGILLDLHNIWTNECNGRQPVTSFIDQIPLERVWEIHVAGGFEFDGYWLDSHSGRLPESVLESAEMLIPRLPNLQAVVYEIFPSFLPLFGLDAVEQELQVVRSLSDRALDASKQRPYGPPPRVASRHAAFPEIAPKVTPEQWENALGELIVDGVSTVPLAQELQADPAIALIRKLVWRFRAGQIIKTLSLLTRLIQLHGGTEYLESLLNDYFLSTRPRPFASQEASSFLEYLKHNRPEIPYLPDIIRYEQSLMRALLDQESQYLSFDYDPRALLAYLNRDRIPTGLQEGSYELEITP